MLALVFGPMWLWSFLVYPAQALRLYVRAAGSHEMRAVRAIFLVLGKFAETVGQASYLMHRWSGRQAQIIEYK